jgi:hypothetical protein
MNGGIKERNRMVERMEKRNQMEENKGMEERNRMVERMEKRNQMEWKKIKEWRKEKEKETIREI